MAVAGLKYCEPRMAQNRADAHIGARIRAVREENNCSAAKLAEHLGVTFAQVQKMERGTNRIGAGRLWQIAQFFGVPVSHFFKGL